MASHVETSRGALGRGHLGRAAFFHRRPSETYTDGRMGVLTAFGAVSVTAMMVCYALETRHPAFILAFAAACVASSAYGFLAGAWPFGVVEL